MFKGMFHENYPNLQIQERNKYYCRMKVKLYGLFSANICGCKETGRYLKESIPHKISTTLKHTKIVSGDKLKTI